MKRSNFFPIQTLIAKVYFITSIILFCNLNTFAQQPLHKLNFKNGSIVYQGLDGDELVFNVEIENQIHRKVSIMILDISGEKIYNRSFSEKTISKRFRIPAGTGPITFVISDPISRKDQRFKIVAEQRYVGEFSVNRML